MIKKFLFGLKSAEGKKKVSIFLICLLISFVFWSFIKLSRQKEIDLSFKVYVENISSDYFIDIPKDPVLNVKCRATGARFLFSGLLGKQNLLNLDFSKLQKSVKQENRSFFMTSSRAEQLLLSEIGSNIEIVSIWPDTLFFDGDKTSDKKVHVALESNVLLKSGYKVYGDILIDPDSVIIRLPDKEFDLVNKVIARLDEKGPLDKSYETLLSLEPDTVINQFTIIPDEVKVSIPVEKYTEAIFIAEIKVYCEDEFYSISDFPYLRLMPENVSVNCLVALTDYNELNSEKFVLAVDCNEFYPKPIAERLKIKLFKFPDKVIVNSFSPDKVDYLILK